MALPGTERFRIGSAMFDAGRAGTVSLRPKSLTVIRTRPPSVGGA